MRKPGTFAAFFIPYSIQKKFVFPDSLSRPDTADIVYRYNKRGGVDTVYFHGVDVVQKFNYNQRGWLDSMLATRNYDTLFSEALFRDVSGNILMQKSKHLGQNEVTQSYDYDRLKRLTHWTDGSQEADFSFDNMGNRTWDRLNTDTSDFTYNGSTMPNRLTQINHRNTNKISLFSYNQNGAVNTRIEMIGLNQTSSEEFSYTMSGLVKKYVKSIFPGGMLGVQTYDWRYRYNWQGAREQKRKYSSPQGDSTGDNIFPWVYYLRGASGEELAVYHGRQHNYTFDTCVPAGQKVYFYANEYLTNGGELTTIPDTANPQGRKEFSIKDHIGSVRCVVGIKDSLLNVSSFDYKPFGDSLGSMQERLGFMDNEFDT